MHPALTSSTDCRYSKPPLFFHYRPGPKVGKHSWGLQLKRCIGATEDPIASLRSRRTIARVNVAVALFVCQITASTVASSARAQTATRSEAVDRFAKFIDSASGRFAVPAPWIRAVMQAESAGDEHAISPRGAMGLMQLMPATWAELSARYGLGLDPFDAGDNILAALHILKRCTIVSARQAFLRPTMQVRGDTNSTS
jgi:soluble lytic murein transglycosylase-like protein